MPVETVVTITLSGKAGSGKTTLARHLAAYLHHEHGFKVTLHDECINGGAGIQCGIPARHSVDLPGEVNPVIKIRAGEQP